MFDWKDKMPWEEEIKMPDGSTQLVEYSRATKTLEIGAGGFGVCPGCKFELRLADPSGDPEGKGLGKCPICSTCFEIVVRE